MSDWGDDTLDEWSKAAAAHTGERLNAMETEPLTPADENEHAEQEGSGPDIGGTPEEPPDQSGDEGGDSA